MNVSAKLVPRARARRLASQRNRIDLGPAEIRATRKAAYSREVADEISKGRHPNVYVFAGPDAWRRAEYRRIHHGPGSALVLPDGIDPESVRWPPVDALVVAWPDSTARAYARKLRLAQALVRDGVRYAAIEHAPDWLSVWREGGKPND